MVYILNIYIYNSSNVMHHQDVLVIRKRWVRAGKRNKRNQKC